MKLLESVVVAILYSRLTEAIHLSKVFMLEHSLC